MKLLSKIILSVIAIYLSVLSVVQISPPTPLLSPAAYLPIVGKADRAVTGTPTATPTNTPTATTTATPTATATTAQYLASTPYIVSIVLQCVQPTWVTTTSRVYDEATGTFIQYRSIGLPCIPPGETSEIGIWYTRYQWSIPSRFSEKQVALRN